MCELCHCRAAPPASPEALAYKPPPPPPRRKPTRYERLFEKVFGALQRAGEQVTGERWCVFGLGDSELPLMGWCPSCKQGTVAVWLLNVDPPSIDVEGCSSGCTWEQVAKALQ